MRVANTAVCTDERGQSLGSAGRWHEVLWAGHSRTRPPM